jgi:hypothetical protein
LTNQLLEEKAARAREVDAHQKLKKKAQEVNSLLTTLVRKKNELASLERVAGAGINFDEPEDGDDSEESDEGENIDEEAGNNV